MTAKMVSNKNANQLNHDFVHTQKLDLSSSVMQMMADNPSFDSLAHHQSTLTNYWTRTVNSSSNKN